MSTPTATLVGNAEKIPSWVWRSNPQTAAAGVLSVTAAIEVIFAVAGYWAIAIYTHGYSRLLTGVLVVPLFLLRSNESVELGARWFSQVDTDITENIETETSSFLYNLAKSYVIMPIILSPIIASLLRTIATSRYIGKGIRQIPDNWWRFLLATEIFSKPELMPGYSNPASFLPVEHLSDIILHGPLRFDSHNQPQGCVDVVDLDVNPASPYNPKRRL